MVDRYRPFKYNVKAEFNKNDGEDRTPIEIPENNIMNVIIDNDYYGKVTPIVWIMFKMPRPLLDMMIKHSDTGTVILTIDKHTVDINNNFVPIERGRYIKDEFVYFINKNRNVLKDTQYEEDNERDIPDEIYIDVTIGFLKLECINKNKKIINTVYRNCTLTDIILYNTRHRKLLMEPLDNKNVYKEIFIPPLETISDLIKYLDDNYNLYTSPHIYYMDLDKSYLLSSSGKNIKSSNDEIESIFINMRNPKGLVGKIQGAHKDEEKYIFESDAEFGVYYNDEITDNKFNTILCVDSEGNKKELKLNLNSFNGSTKKYKLERVTNLNKGNIIKNKIELPKILFRISKNDLDASLLTPNKSYFVYNEDLEDKHYDGQYILSEKKELFIKSGDIFENNAILFLRKIS